MLHILINSPYKIDIKILLNMMDSLDCFIAIQDGVIITIENSIFISKIITITKKLYVLKEDLLSRGIKKYISSEFKIINYKKFAVLTEKYNKFMNW